MTEETLDTLMEQWEQNYRKGLLSFWMLLVISERPMYAYEMKEEIESLSNGALSADENSIYRALRRFAKGGLVDSEKRPSEIGPDRRYFMLTPLGEELLSKFVKRNILIYQSKKVTQTINHLLNGHAKEENNG